MTSSRDFLRTYTRNQHCSNCGKFGHLNRSCKDPITSFGIICVRFTDPSDIVSFKEELRNQDAVCISSYNVTHNRFLSAMHRYKDSFRFLLIRRRHSLGMLEFVRGRYDVRDYQGITRLFRLMSSNEISLIRDSVDFRDIWNSIWTKPPAGSTSNRSSYEDEYDMSKAKFKTLQSDYKKENVLGLAYYTTQVTPEWDTPEWGFPKGRRSYHEKNIECASREFEEETGYSCSDHSIIHAILPIKEVFHGTNNIPYKHVYYFSTLTNPDKEPVIEESNREIGDVGWFTYSEAIKLIRPYHVEKRNLLHEAFKYVGGVLEAREERPSRITGPPPGLASKFDHECLSPPTAACCANAATFPSTCC